MTPESPAPGGARVDAPAEEGRGPRRDVAGGGVARAVSWMPYVLLGGLLLGVVRAVAVPVSNADTFFHLRYGHEFLTDWTPWHPGHVSTLGHRDWVPTQWLSQVAMAATESLAGLAGVVWLMGVLVLATVVAVFLVTRRYADPLPAALVTVLVVLGSQANLAPRPQVVSYLLILLVTHAWLGTAQDLRPRWWIVPATWAWALLHGMWPIGVVIGLVAIVGIALDRRGRVREPRPVLLRLLAVPVLSVCVAALTPVGPKLFSAVLLVGGRGKFHDEWAATDFHMRQAAVVAAMIAVTLVVWLRSGGGPGPGPAAPRPAWVPLLLLLLAAAWSAYAVRTVPVAAMMAAPLLAGALQSVVGRRRPGPRREARLVGGLAGVAVVLLTVLVPFTSAQSARVPSWVNPALDALPDGTTVQTTDILGGYLMWRHPELNPVIDGYSDAYTTTHLQAQLDLQLLRPGWDRTLRRSGATYAMLPTRSRLAYELSRSQGWQILHASDAVVLLQAPPGWSP